ncbi:MAG: two-component system sensor histidine kinase NtrB [Betaproteobacteria bacterium]
MKNLWRMSSEVREKKIMLARKGKAPLAAPTGRRRVEEERSLLAATLELSTDGIVMTDSRGFIRYVNSAFEQITGYSKEEVLGRSLHCLDSGRHDDAFYDMIRKTIAQGGMWKGRFISKKKDGTLYHEDCIHALVKGPAGEVISHVSIRRDVTERLKLEAVAEEVDSEKNIGYIFSGARHEIGNAINSLVIILSVMKAKFKKLDPQAVEESLDRASDLASKTAYIVRSLKNCNRYMKPELACVNLPKFIADFRALIQDDFTAKGIELTTSLDADTELCYADPRSLQQILLNLFINAADALKGREHPKVSLALFGTGDNIRIRVEDNGWGMSEEQLHNIFKPFYTTKEHGTGLGLVIVRRLLAAMNGSIEVSSHKDVGTTMDITIPREAAITGNTKDVF